MKWILVRQPYWPGVKSKQMFFVCKQISENEYEIHEQHSYEGDAHGRVIYLNSLERNENVARS